MCLWKDASVSLFGRGCWRIFDKKRASFFCQSTQVFMFADLFPTTLTFPHFSSVIPELCHCQCQWSKAHCQLWVVLHCFVRGSQLSLILSKRKWGERSLKWSEVVIVNVEPIFIVQRPLVSSVAMLLRLASPLTLELTKLTVTLSMQHPGVQGEGSPQGTMTLQFLWPTLLLVQF